MGYGPGILYLFTTALQTSILGALLTFAPRAWYQPYLATSSAWHLTPLEDQQLGGLIMWIPGGSVLLFVALVLLVRWLDVSQVRWQYTRIADMARSPQQGAQ
jgi:putative membrane protein